MQCSGYKNVDHQIWQFYLYKEFTFARKKVKTNGLVLHCLKVLMVHQIISWYSLHLISYDTEIEPLFLHKAQSFKKHSHLQGFFITTHTQEFQYLIHTCVYWICHIWRVQNRTGWKANNSTHYRWAFSLIVMHYLWMLSHAELIFKAFRCISTQWKSNL